MWHAAELLEGGFRCRLWRATLAPASTAAVNETGAVRGLLLRHHPASIKTCCHSLRLSSSRVLRNAMGAPAVHRSGSDCACPACCLTQARPLAHNDQDLESLATQFQNALMSFREQPEALDETLFDCFARIVELANLSQSTSKLVDEYIHLVLGHCSGREILTLLMATLDAAST